MAHSNTEKMTSPRHSIQRFQIALNDRRGGGGVLPMDAVEIFFITYRICMRRINVGKRLTFNLFPEISITMGILVLFAFSRISHARVVFYMLFSVLKRT